jgi:excisionase family DNA binding protein
MSRWGRIAGVADLQGWRTLAEVAKELGVTDRTLQRRLAEAGIRPARPGRTPMLSDPDVTKLMEESRRRSGSPKSAPAPRSPDEGTRQHAGDTRGLLTEIRNIERILDGT